VVRIQIRETLLQAGSPAWIAAANLVIITGGLFARP
jgi:hypothetical protein